MEDWKAAGNAEATDSEVLFFGLLITHHLVFPEAVSNFCSEIEAYPHSLGGVFKAPTQLTHKGSLVGGCLVGCFVHEGAVLRAAASAMADFDGDGRVSGALPVTTLQQYVQDHQKGKVLGPVYDEHNSRRPSQKRVLSALPRIVDLLRTKGWKFLENNPDLCSVNQYRVRIPICG